MEAGSRYDGRFRRVRTRRGGVAVPTDHGRTVECERSGNRDNAIPEMLWQLTELDPALRRPQYRAETLTPGVLVGLHHCRRGGNFVVSVAVVEALAGSETLC
jgi:hypothetical protein